MKRKRQFFKCLLFLSMTILFVACKRTDFSKIAEGGISPTLALPLGYASYSLKDVFRDTDSSGGVQVGNQGDIKLVYSSELEVFSAKDVFDVDDQAFTQDGTAAQYGVTLSVAYNGTQVTPIDISIPFNTDNGVKLTEVDFLQGILNLSATTTLMHKVTVDLQFPDLKVNGTPISRTLVMNTPTSIPQSSSTSASLQSAILELDNGTQGFNQVRIVGSVTIEGQGNMVMGTEELDFSVGLSGLEYDVLRGDFGTAPTVNYKDKLDLSVFSNLISGNIVFTNPSIIISADNSFGVPMELDLKEFKTVETETGNEYDLIGHPMDFAINPATTPGQSTLSQLVLDKTNTQNIGSVVSPAPKELHFDVDAKFNPNATTQHFISQNSALSVGVDMELPLEGYVTEMTIKDTLPINFDNIPTSSENVLRLITNNGFPIELKVDVLITDDKYNVTTDLNPGDNVLLKGAEVNSQGRVIGRAKKISEISLNSDQMAKLSSGSYMIVTISGATTNANEQQVIKFYNDYGLDIKLGLRYKVEQKF